MLVSVVLLRLAAGQAKLKPSELPAFEWELLARQTGVPAEATDAPKGNPKWAALNVDNRDAKQYGNLNAAVIEKYRGRIASLAPDGFLFRLQWNKPGKGGMESGCPTAAPCSVVWAQTSNLMKGGTEGLKVIADDSVAPDGAGGGGRGGFKGLVPCNGPAIVCSPTPWWYCMGCSGVCAAPTFPGGGGCQEESEIWIAIKETHHGWDVVFLLLGASVVYVGGGVGYASTGGRSKGSSGASMLMSHPLHALHAQIPGLVRDGVAFVRRKVAGGQSYQAVAAAPAAPAAVAFAKGDSVEYLSSSKGEWKLTVVTSVDKKKRTVDTKVKLGIKDMNRLRAFRVVQEAGGKVDKKAQAKLEKVFILLTDRCC